MNTYTAYFTNGTNDTYEAANDWDAVTIAKREFVRYYGPDNTDMEQLVPESVYRRNDNGSKTQVY